MFCNEVERSVFPTMEETMLLFVTHLARQGLTYGTIKVYLSAVSNLHVTAGLHNAFAAQLTPRLVTVLRDIKL